jgi:hypothetical protein
MFIYENRINFSLLVRTEGLDHVESGISSVAVYPVPIFWGSDA